MGAFFIWYTVACCCNSYDQSLSIREVLSHNVCHLFQSTWQTIFTAQKKWEVQKHNTRLLILIIMVTVATTILLMGKHQHLFLAKTNRLLKPKGTFQL